MMQTAFISQRGYDTQRILLGPHSTPQETDTLTAELSAIWSELDSEQ